MRPSASNPPPPSSSPASRADQSCSLALPVRPHVGATLRLNPRARCARREAHRSAHAPFLVARRLVRDERSRLTLDGEAPEHVAKPCSELDSHQSVINMVHLARHLRPVRLDGDGRARNRAARRIRLAGARLHAVQVAETAEEVLKLRRAGWTSPKNGAQLAYDVRAISVPAVVGRRVCDIEARHVLEVLQPIIDRFPESLSRVRQRMPWCSNGLLSMGAAPTIRPS